MTLLRESFDRAYPGFPAGTPFWRDRSFTTLLDRCKALEALRYYLPADLSRPSYVGQESVEAVDSTFKDHGYGRFFYALARTMRLRRCVELGVHQGFSLPVGCGARWGQWHGEHPGLDLFEDYPHRHANYADVEKHISACRLDSWSEIAKVDAIPAHEHYEDLDYLHVDLSNDGDTYRSVFRHWADKVRKVILLEGGSAERDRVEWMIRHRKSPIVPAIDEIRHTHPEWRIVILAPYPSLTVAVRSGICSEPALP